MDDPRYGKFDLEARVLRWRACQEHASSLSPRELDELEDHLRARVDLELELSPPLRPARAFRVASREIGTAAALSKEFAKAGKPRWKALFSVGWAMFAASFVLPVAGFEFLSVWGSYERANGFEVFLRWLGTASLFIGALPNFAMLLTIPAFRGREVVGGRWLRRFLAFAGAGAIGLGVILSLDHSAMMAGWGVFSARALFGAGYWTWAASLTCVAVALHLRARGWASAELRAPAAPAGQRALQ